MQLRRQQRRNFLTTLFLSQGVPMITAGDEWARTQQGNNNAYCQDNEISWLNWQHDDEQKALLEFTKRLIQLRREHPIFRRPKFFQGRRIRGSEIRDVMWFNPGGNEMNDDEWNSPFVRCLGMLLSGDTIDVQTFEGEPIRDDTFLLLINAHHEPLQFVLPGEKEVEWQLLLDTAVARGILLETPTNYVWATNWRSKTAPRCCSSSPPDRPRRRATSRGRSGSSRRRTTARRMTKMREPAGRRK